MGRPPWHYRWDTSGKNNSFYFALVLANGRKVVYTFWSPRSPSGEDSVMDNLDAFIKAYNTRSGAGHTIAYRYLWFEYRGGKTVKPTNGIQ